MQLTRQQWVDGLSVAGGLLVEECLSVEVDTLKVFGRTHVDQVPAHKLVGVHPQALQVVYNAIDGLGNDRQKTFFIIFGRVTLFFCSVTNKSRMHERKDIVKSTYRTI